MDEVSLIMLTTQDKVLWIAGSYDEINETLNPMHKGFHSYDIYVITEVICMSS